MKLIQGLNIMLKYIAGVLARCPDGYTNGNMVIRHQRRRIASRSLEDGHLSRQIGRWTLGRQIRVRQNVGKFKVG